MFSLTPAGGLYQRKADNERVAAEAERQRAEADEKIIEKLGSGRLKILMFYANPPVVGSGERPAVLRGFERDGRTNRTRCKGSGTCDQPVRGDSSASRYYLYADGEGADNCASRALSR